MGFHWLGNGTTGALEAAAIALLAGFLVYAIAHALRGYLGWKQGSEIGVSWIVAAALSACVDGWDLFHLGLIRLQSSYVVAQTLLAIHDPESLGLRIVFELMGAAVGVMLGWLLLSARR